MFVIAEKAIFTMWLMIRYNDDEPAQRAAFTEAIPSSISSFLSKRVPITCITSLGLKISAPSGRFPNNSSRFSSEPKNTGMVLLHKSPSLPVVNSHMAVVFCFLSWILMFAIKISINV
uniref:Wsv185 n=1 Tax=White spot syndrome virus TaxID=92652 RepID=A0A2U9GC26_WSSV|nr:wsv185 [Shrimp white spot syndrome virus]